MAAVSSVTPLPAGTDVLAHAIEATPRKSDGRRFFSLKTRKAKIVFKHMWGSVLYDAGDKILATWFPQTVSGKQTEATPSLSIEADEAQTRFFYEACFR